MKVNKKEVSGPVPTPLLQHTPLSLCLPHPNPCLLWKELWLHLLILNCVIVPSKPSLFLSFFLSVPFTQNITLLLTMLTNTHVPNSAHGSHWLWSHCWVDPTLGFFLSCSLSSLCLCPSRTPQCSLCIIVWCLLRLFSSTLSPSKASVTLYSSLYLQECNLLFMFRADFRSAPCSAAAQQLAALSSVSLTCPVLATGFNPNGYMLNEHA